MGDNEAGPQTPGAASWDKYAAMHRGWPVWKGKLVIGRMTGAAARGLFVALLVLLPALVLPGVAADSTQISVLVALLAAFLTFVEYNSNFPSIMEFRDAPPFNRLLFYNNCFKNGILPIALPQEQVDVLMKDAEKGANARMTIDLEAQTVTTSDGETFSFELDSFKKHCLMNGLDDIGLTMEKAAAIDSFETAVAQSRPWV